MPNFGYGAQVFNDLFAATRTYYAKKLLDTLPRTHPLLDKVAGKGNISAKEGGVGKRNVELILARTNQNVRWVGFNDPITATNVSLLEQIEWDWKFCYQDFVINDKVLAINSSDELASLLELNQRALRNGFSRAMAQQLYSDGTQSGALSGLEMGGLQYLLSADPYTKGLVVLQLQRGGTPGDKYEFWRNRAGQFQDVTNANPKPTTLAPYQIDFSNKSDAAAKLVDAMRHMIMTIHTLEKGLDGIYLNYKWYDLYIYYMQEKLHINNVAGEKKDVGFSTVTFMDIPIYLDKYCPENQLYFINSDTLHFKYLEGENFKQEVRQVPNYFAKQYITTFIGNFIIERPRLNGVITSSTAAPTLPADCNICDFAKFHDYDYPSTPISQSSDTYVERTDYSASGVYRPEDATAAARVKGKTIEEVMAEKKAEEMKTKKK
jgi:hypothetical protein